jgi:peptidoglycan/LPS O-acetylase OafA/YrhL
MAFLVGFYSTWLVHLSRGPLWDLTIGPEYRSCRTKWWTNLLYINNYFNMNKMVWNLCETFKSNFLFQCFSHGWYLAVDMQFYLLSLLLLWLMWKWQKKIYITLGTILILHFAALFTVIYKSHYKFSIRATPE